MQPAHKPTFRLPARLLLALFLALTACGRAGTGTVPAPAAGQEAHSAKPREVAPAAAPGDLDALAAGNRDFAFDLYQAIRSEDGNLFYSPYSISLALAMTYGGARGDTESEMAAAMHYTLPQAKLHPAFNALDLALAEAADDEPAFKLNIANAVWGQQGFDLLPDYLDLLAVNYGAGLRLADFQDPAEREQAREAINTWVSDATEQKIKELFPEGILNDGTRLVLANAIYFKADWETPFPREGTGPAPFTLLDGSQVSVPTMTRRAGTGYVAGDGYQALELYYKGGRASLVILLPDAGQFADFEAGLDAERVDEMVNGLQPMDLQIYVPKYEYAASLDLGDTLAGLGMPAAFDPDAADFSGIDGRRDLYLTSVVHKAFVAVDEKGTEAAAATGVVAGITSMPQVVAVDRPFVFLIRDAETGTVLFVGRVLNPAAE